MDYEFKDDYIFIHMNSEKSLLKVIWSSSQQCMSLTEFSQCLSFIYNEIDTFRPQTILIDSLDFNYRKTPELELFFSLLEQHFDSVKVALLIGNRLLGKITLEKIKQHNNMIIFRNRMEALEWENSLASF
jgi:hypothetical protein